MVKVFTLNKNKKIELTEQELKELLDASYWEGYNSNYKSWTYTTPNEWWKSPYYTTSTSGTLTVNTSDVSTCISNTNTNSTK